MQPYIQSDCSVGDAISLAIRHCRRDIRFLIGKLWWPSVIELIGKVFFLLCGQTLIASSHTHSWAPLLNAAGLFLIGLTFGGPAEVWMTVRQLAYVRMTILKVDSYQAAMNQVRNRSWAVVAIVVFFYILLFVWGLLSGLGLALSATVMGFISAPPMMNIVVLFGLFAFIFIALVVFLLPLSLVFAVLACEDMGIFESFGKAVSMTAKKFIRVFSFSVLIMFVYLAISFALSSAVQVLYGIEYMRAGVYSGMKTAADVHVPLYVQVIGCVWQSVISMFISPILFLSSGFFYYALRTKDEGLDLMEGVGALRLPPGTTRRL